MGIPLFDTLNLAIVGFIVVLVFLMGREIVLWYFRISESLKNQRRIIELLEQIVANQEDMFNASQAAQPQARVPTP